MLWLYAQAIDDDLWKTCGFLVPDVTLPLLDKVDHHISQLGIFVQVPEVGCGLSTFLLLLFGLVSTL